MRALVFDAGTVHYRQHAPEPKPGAGEALLRVALAGICQTDLEIAKGYMNFTGTLGHEFVGTVEQAPDARWIGKRVVGEINCVCGKCDLCQRGLSTHCRNRTVLGIAGRNGAFADYCVLPVRNLHEVPANISAEEAVFVEPLAAAVQVTKQVQIDKRTHVMVLGDGRLGQLVARVMKLTGCTLLLVGKREDKLSIAERAGVPTRLLRDVQVRRDQDVVIDCTGRGTGLEQALALVRPRGTVVLKTTVAAGQPLNLAPVVIDEITVLGSRCGPFADALQLLATKQVDVTGLITRRTKPEQAAGYITDMPGGMLKVVVDFGR